MAETWYPAKYLYTTSLCWLLILNTFILHKKKQEFVLQDVYDNRSEKMVEVMDKCEKGITEVNLFFALPIDNI